MLVFHCRRIPTILRNFRATPRSLRMVNEMSTWFPRSCRLSSQGRRIRWRRSGLPRPLKIYPSSRGRGHVIWYIRSDRGPSYMQRWHRCDNLRNPYVIFLSFFDTPKMRVCFFVDFVSWLWVWVGTPVCARHDSVGVLRPGSGWYKRELGVPQGLTLSLFYIVSVGLL